MDPKRFHDLIIKRKKWIQSSKENNFDFDSILAGIYNDPSHFIYEILQNAEDAGASEISFILKTDTLEIRHNGREFNFKDVDGITGIGISTKKDDLNSIGKFGVGFKSVFAITKTPFILSGPYHFMIEDFVVPVPFEKSRITKTLITLPFNHPTRKKEEVYEIVSKKLEGLDLKTLLFLKNIINIRWETPNQKGRYHNEITTLEQIKNVFKTSLISSIAGKKRIEEFIIIRRAVKLDTYDLSVEIGYRLGSSENGDKVIEKERDAKLSVFFPTEKVTFLNFLIQGPYKTTPNRENIPLDDLQNQYLIKETAELVAKSIAIIKSLGLLSVSFLEVLPIDQNHSDDFIYSLIFEKVKDKLLSKEYLLPTSKGRFSTAEDALLARGKELTEILDKDDINILFGKKNWLTPDITYDRTRQLRDYLINELNIKEVDFENFAVSLNHQFLVRKTDEWFIDFYGKLLNQRSLWEESSYYSRNEGVLRKKPIIKLSNNEIIEPFDKENRVQVYLPTRGKTKYKTVKGIFTENEKSAKFLNDLGLSRPDIFAEIREFIIPKYNKTDVSIGDDEYYDDIDKLLNALTKEESERKSEIFTDLSKLSIVFCRKSNSDEQWLVNPSEAYFQTPELLEYFNGADSIYFISDDFGKKLPDKMEELVELFLKLGCEDKPRRISIESTLTNEEKRLLRKNNYESNITYEFHTKDYDFEGLDNFVKVLSKERSIILWDFLLGSLHNFNNRNKHLFFLGEYKWNYRIPHYQNFDSKFLKTLKQTAWVIDESGMKYRPNEFSISTLPEWYNNNDEEIEILTDIIGFQTDEIKRLEEKTGKKVFLLNEEQAKKVMELLGINGDKSDPSLGNNEEQWTPEVEPENTKVSFEILEPKIIVTTDLRGQRPDDNDEGDEGTDNNQDSLGFKKEMMSITELKDIGNWGERFVYKHLQESFADDIHIKIIWLNNEKNVGVGYDFSIIRNGKEIEYIEVKSKIDNSPQLIEITGAQWEFARKLYNEKEGEKYKIYVVSAAGSKKAKIGIINNPIKLWKEGKLYAHPVQFKL